jgi:hypothetical protein
LQVREGALGRGLGVLVARDIDVDDGAGGDVRWEKDGGELNLRAGAMLVRRLDLL